MEGERRVSRHALLEPYESLVFLSFLDEEKGEAAGVGVVERAARRDGWLYKIPHKKYLLGLNPRVGLTLYLVYSRAQKETTPIAVFASAHAAFRYAALHILPDEADEAQRTEAQRDLGHATGLLNDVVVDVYVVRPGDLTTRGEMRTASLAYQHGVLTDTLQVGQEAALGAGPLPLLGEKSKGQRVWSDLINLRRPGEAEPRRPLLKAIHRRLYPVPFRQDVVDVPLEPNLWLRLPPAVVRPFDNPVQSIESWAKELRTFRGRGRRAPPERPPEARFVVSAKLRRHLALITMRNKSPPAFPPLAASLLMHMDSGCFELVPTGKSTYYRELGAVFARQTVFGPLALRTGNICKGLNLIHHALRGARPHALVITEDDFDHATVALASDIDDANSIDLLNQLTDDEWRDELWPILTKRKGALRQRDDDRMRQLQARHTDRAAKALRHLDRRRLLEAGNDSFIGQAERLRYLLARSIGFAPFKTMIVLRASPEHEKEIYEANVERTRRQTAFHSNVLEPRRRPPPLGEEEEPEEEEERLNHEMHLSGRRAIPDRIAYLHNKGQLMGHMTVVENIMVGRHENVPNLNHQGDELLPAHYDVLIGDTASLVEEPALVPHDVRYEYARTSVQLGRSFARYMESNLLFESETRGNESVLHSHSEANGAYHFRQGLSSEVTEQAQHRRRPPGYRDGDAFEEHVDYRSSDVDLVKQRGLFGLQANTYLLDADAPQFQTEESHLFEEILALLEPILPGAPPAPTRVGLAPDPTAAEAIASAARAQVPGSSPGPAQRESEEDRMQGLQEFVDVPPPPPSPPTVPPTRGAPKRRREEAFAASVEEQTEQVRQAKRARIGTEHTARVSELIEAGKTHPEALSIAMGELHAKFLAELALERQRQADLEPDFDD
jgi:hypothetical protein